MKLVDSNVLIYAVNGSMRQHASAHGWLVRALSGTESVGLPWTTVLAFIRVVTSARVFPAPYSVAEALDIGRGWLSTPNVVMVEPSSQHFAILGDLLERAGTAGNLTTDAHLAALAIEHQADVVTFDRDFERFGVRVVVPQ